MNILSLYMVNVHEHTQSIYRVHRNKNTVKFIFHMMRMTKLLFFVKQLLFLSP